jgi:hypothetical protein
MTEHRGTLVRLYISSNKPLTIVATFNALHDAFGDQVDCGGGDRYGSLRFSSSLLKST